MAGRTGAPTTISLISFAPALTITLAGTVAEALSLPSAIVAPPAGAGAVFQPLLAFRFNARAMAAASGLSFSVSIGFGSGIDQFGH